MISLFPIAIIIALGAFAAAITHLNQGFAVYFDVVALLMVFGGTTAVGIVLVPWQLRRDLFRSAFDLLRPMKTGQKQVLNDAMNTIKDRQLRVNDGAKSEIYAQTLRDGVELIELGFSSRKIRGILLDRLASHGRRRRKVANAIRSLAKYPPAFGLMGTVLGLVNVMRGVSAGNDGKQTALDMAIALIATMYGLVVANLFVNPAGELILKKTIEEESFGEIAVEAVCLLADETSLLECQESLNSFAAVENRIDIIRSQIEEAA